MAFNAKLYAKYGLDIAVGAAPVDEVLQMVYEAVRLTAQALHQWYGDSQLMTLTAEQHPKRYSQPLTPRDVFRLMVGELTVQSGEAMNLDDRTLTVGGSPDKITVAAVIFWLGRRIDSYADDYGTESLIREGIVHAETGQKISFWGEDDRWHRSNSGMNAPLNPAAGDASDEWAEMLVHWVLGDFDDSAVGQDRLNKMNRWLFVALAANLADTSVPDSVAERLEAVQQFLAADAAGIGRAVMDFVGWQVQRGALNPVDDVKNPGSVWWRLVNGQVMRDMEESRLIHLAEMGEVGSILTVNRWVAYLRERSVRRLYAAFVSSMAEGYLLYEKLAFAELLAEQVLMADVMVRLLMHDPMPVLADQRLGDAMLDRAVIGVMQSAGLREDFFARVVADIAAVYPYEYSLSLTGSSEVILRVFVASLVLERDGFISYASVTPESVRRGARLAAGEDVEAMVRDIVYKRGDDTPTVELVREINQEVRRINGGAGGCLELMQSWMWRR